MSPLRVGLALTALCALFAVSAAHAADNMRGATPPPGKALVLVFRSERDPVSTTVPVSANSERIGELANGTFATATVKPGITFLRAGDRVLTTLSLEAEANMTYFVWIEAIPGVSPIRSEMRLVSESAGRRSLEQSRFVGVPTAVVAVSPVQQPAQAAKPVSQDSWPASAPPGSTISGRGWDIAIIPKASTFKLAEGNQVVAGLASNINPTSKPVFGLEVEWRSDIGVAFGGEIFYYKNELTAAGPPPLRAEQEVLAFTANGKYYFRVASWFYPFLGAGIGFTDTKYSGGITGDSSGFAYQGLAGMEIRPLRHVGVYLSYKRLFSTTKDTAGEKVNVGGRAFMGGVSIIF